MSVIKIPMAILVAWMIFSIAVVVIGVGMAGGITNASFTPPLDDALAFILWALSAIIVLFPFVVLFLKAVYGAVRD